MSWVPRAALKPLDTMGEVKGLVWEGQIAGDIKRSSQWVKFIECIRNEKKTGIQVKDASLVCIGWWHRNKGSKLSKLAQEKWAIISAHHWSSHSSLRSQVHIGTALLLLYQVHVDSYFVAPCWFLPLLVIIVIDIPTVFLVVGYRNLSKIMHPFPVWDPWKLGLASHDTYMGQVVIKCRKARWRNWQPF